MTDYLPIREISTYQKTWTICGRVTGKSAIRSFGKTGGGKVFNVEILDASGSEIRANFFNSAAEKLFEKLQKGRCYTFSRGTVRVANKQYNSTNHKYELVFDKLFQVEDAADDAQISSLQLHVVELASLRTRALPCKVDLCGVVIEASPCDSMLGKDNQELHRRILLIADASGCSMSIALWGERAKVDESKFANNPVLGLKSVLVRERGSSLSGSHLAEGELIFNPQGELGAKVQQWWQQGGSTQSLLALTEEQTAGESSGPQQVATLQDLRDLVPNVTTSQVFTVFARLQMVQLSRQGEPMPLYYKACQESKGNLTCWKRVDDNGFCVGCNRMVRHELKMNIRCHYSDSQDSNWIGTFHDPAVAILGMDADDLAEKQAQGGREAVDTSVMAQYYARPWQLMVRAKRDADRITVGVMDACPVDLPERGRDLLQEVREMLAD